MFINSMNIIVLAQNKMNIIVLQKTKIMASGPITLQQIGKKVEAATDFIGLQNCCGW